MCVWGGYPRDGFWGFNLFGVLLLLFPNFLHACCLSSVLQRGGRRGQAWYHVGWQVPCPDIAALRVSVHVQGSAPGRDGGADREMNFVSAVSPQLCGRTSRAGSGLAPQPPDISCPGAGPGAALHRL